MKLFKWVVISWGLVLLFSACGGGILKPSPTLVKLEIEATGTINPDIQNKSSPVVIRLYQLKSRDKFKDADFIALYENEEHELGDDLVHRQEILVTPGEKKFMDLETDDRVKAIAVLGAFRQHQSGHWGSLLMLEPHQKNIIHVLISGTTVSMRQKP